jgi:flagellar hook-associated protein 1 FlgK
MANALNIGLSGLQAAQIGMDVTSHNIANVNTANFQRQLVDFSEVSFPSGNPTIPSGAGVKVSNIHNATDMFLSNNYPNALSNSSEYSTLAGLAKPLDDLLNNPSLNLSDAMQNVFNSFQDVANTPTSIPIRQNAIDQAQTLVDKSKSLVGELNTMQGSLNAQLNQNMVDANSLVSNIANINSSLQLSSNNADLIAQRDGLINDLSKLTGITVSPDKNTIVTTSGKTLLQGGVNVNPLTSNDLATISGGSIGGTNKFITTMLNPAIAKFPGVMQDFTNAVNVQSTKGFDLNGNTGTAIFNSPNGTLSDYSVNITDPRTLGAASVANAVGDGSNAQTMSDIKKQLFGGQTLQQEYGNLVSSADSQTNNANNMSNMYSGISDNFASQLHNLSGVNLDEEAANLLKYQQMYQANAKVIQAEKDMFGTLINITA